MHRNERSPAAHPSGAGLDEQEQRGGAGGEAVGGAGPRRFNRMPSKLHLRRERLRLARDPQQIREAADQFLQHHQLPPDDPEILLKMLQHPDEPVLRMVMSELSSLIYQGRLHNGLLLLARLDEVAQLPDLQANTRDLMVGLREQATRLQAAGASKS